MRTIYTLILLCCTLTSTAQADKWTGTWRMDYKPWPGQSYIRMDLQIGAAERQTLYPAKLTLTYGEFSGVYEVLLAKKNDGQLGIGRGKFPIQEKPFRVGQWMLYLNGTFDFTKKGLSLQRMWISNFGIFMRGLYDGDEIYVQSKADLRDFLYRDSITLKKINNIPWTDPHTYRILHPEKDSVYYGIYDKITVTDSVLHVLMKDEDVIDKDTVSMLLNGKLVLDRAFISGEEKELTLPIDTGMNILIFFADNYGRLPPNTGAFRVRTDSGYYTYDFSHRANAYATFLVGQFYRTPKPPVSKLQEDPRITLRKNSLVEQLTVADPLAELELWDDAAEDGDTVSILLNDRVVFTGFPVLRQRQKLSVVLKPGVNRLVLIADNLGSIPPNTAVMKITAGTTKKYVRIKTDLKQNNLLLINYQPPAP